METTKKSEQTILDRPWHTEPALNGGWNLRDAHGNTKIAHILDAISGEAHRAFIVRAVNSHDDLLAVCRVALDWIEETGEPTGVTDELRDAIEKAKTN